MSRLKKREGKAIGLRRLSKRIEAGSDFVMVGWVGCWNFSLGNIPALTAEWLKEFMEPDDLQVAMK